MTIFSATGVFDLRALDLNLFVRAFVSDVFIDGPGDEGDVYTILATGAATLGVGGPELVENPTGPPVSGLVTAFSVRVPGAGNVGWGVGTISVAFGDIYAAMLSSGNGDDRALFADLLSGDDQIALLEGDNWMDGFGGDDQILAGAGNDSLAGGVGADTVFGGGGRDRLWGEAGADLLVGAGGVDTLAGGGGTDILIGGGGGDRLAGGTGPDRFAFSASGEGGDTIVDFADGDAITVLGAAFGGLTPGPLAAGRFQARADNLAQDAGDRFVFRTPDSSLWFDADGSGADEPVLLATLTNGFDLTAGHILVL